MAGPHVDDEFDKDEFVDEFGDDEPSEPWHNSTRAVLGASVLGVAVIGVLIGAVMLLTGGNDATDAPADFVDPSFSATTGAETPTSGPTTTPTITSTTPISTTEINGPPPPPTSSDTSDTSGSSSSSSESPGVRTPHTREREESPGGPTSRRPRFNVTRTLQPQPIG